MDNLASLIRQRNSLDKEIAEILGRPVIAGHFGEFVASSIFNIELNASANKRETDGHFWGERLCGKSVNIKYYPKNEGILDMSKDGHPDFYLVLAGPRASATSSRGKHRPWLIESVYLFDALELLSKLKVKVGTATSVRREFWEEAEIYPVHKPHYPLNQWQREMLELFNR